MSLQRDDVADEYWEDAEYFDQDDRRCPQCFDGEEPDLLESGCIDDLCHGGPVPCMHGDYTTAVCALCGKRP